MNEAIHVTPIGTITVRPLLIALTTGCTMDSVTWKYVTPTSSAEAVTDDTAPATPDATVTIVANLACPEVISF